MTKKLVALGSIALLLTGAGCAGQDTTNATSTNSTPSTSSTSDMTGSTSSTGGNMGMTSSTEALAVTSADKLRMDMRRLWEDHITWTRLYAVSAANNLPDKDAIATRLLRNQVDIGDAIKPYYGTAAGEQLTTLLKQHISGAVDLVAAKSKDTSRFGIALAAWRKNGDDIATFLSNANPNGWPAQTMKDMMKEHLDTTLNEIYDTIDKKSSTSVNDYDIVKNTIYNMSDMLSDGIIKQFPDKFTR